MKPIFTIHAGEYIVGQELKRRYKDCEVWIPSKDTGTDLLVTNRFDRSFNVSLQVKFSKDFLPDMRTIFKSGLSACGWWTLNPEKIQKSNAEFWVFVPYEFGKKKAHFLIIKPVELLERLEKIHGKLKTYSVYLWVTNNNEDKMCFETRDIGSQFAQEIAQGQYENVDACRNLSQYLENWQLIDDKLNYK
jgi:hypothetical protein